MGRIDVNRERGIRITEKPQGNINTAGYSHVSQGVSNIGRATENVARGIQNVGDTLFKIYNDQADSRNRLEFLEGQTQLFNLTQKSNEELEERINNGEFDGKDGLALFKSAVDKASGGINKELEEWANKNMSSDDMRKELLARSNLDRQRNFAHLSGRFIAHDNKRKWDIFNAQINDAVKMGNKENGKRIIDAYCVGKSEEFKKNLLNEFERKFTYARLDDFKANIVNAVSVEEVNSLVQQASDMGLFNGMPDGDKNSPIPLYRLVNKKTQSLEQAEQLAKQKQAKENKKLQKELAEQQSKDVNAFISGLKGRIQQDVFSSVTSGKVKINWADYDDQFEKVLSMSTISAHEKDKLRGDWAKDKLAIAEYAQNSLNKVLFERTTGFIIAGRNDDKGRVDVGALFDNDSMRAKQAMEDSSHYDDLVRLGWKKYDKEKLEYNKRTLDVFTKILKWDAKADEQGKIAKLILQDAQSFDSATRKQLTDTLFNKVVKGVDFPQNWSKKDIDKFDDEFEKFIEWEDEDDSANMSDYYALRERVMNLARIRNLSLKEALIELQDDQFYQQQQLNKNRKLVRKFLGL